MEHKDTKRMLLEYNSIIKENDDLYRNIAKSFGVSDCAFWILYALREENQELTQREICHMMYQPKQTVNSALKKLEQEGYIALAEMQDRRSKEICLTEKGKELAKGSVDKVFQAEQEALEGLTEAEQEAFVGLFQKYTELLKHTMQKWKEEEQ